MMKAYRVGLIVAAILLLAAWTHGSIDQAGTLITDPTNSDLITDPNNGNLVTR